MDELDRLLEREGFLQGMPNAVPRGMTLVRGDRDDRAPRRIRLAPPPTSAPPAVASDGSLVIPTSGAPGAGSLLARPEALALLAELVAIERQKIPAGVVTSINLLLTTQNTTVGFDPPVLSVQIINDSLTTIQFRVPDGPQGTWTTIKTTETVGVSFDFPVISSVGFLIVPTATGLAVRLFGQR